MFLNFITTQENNLKIFDLNYIKIYLDYQWGKLKTPYFRLLFAYILNNILMVIYVAIQEVENNCSAEDYEQRFCKNSLVRIYTELVRPNKFDKFFFVARLVLLIISVLLIYFQYIQSKNSNNFLTKFFLWINIAYVIK